jgi:transposase
MAQPQYVGIDLHRRRSVIVRMNAAGTVVGEARIDNDAKALAAEIGRAGEAPEVVLEATYGWYWAVDVLEALGCRVHLAHPLGIKAFELRRLKNDRLDARLLADLLRMGRLPEAWIAPRPVRELRELVRYRHKLVDDRSGLKAQVHAVLAKEGVRVATSDLFGVGGTQLLDVVPLAEAYCTRVESLRDLIEVYDREIAMLDRLITRRLGADPGYRAVQAIPGVGPVLAAVFVAEIGDVTRFGRPTQLCSWAGLTPRHRESDDKVHRGHITKQGSPLVRWAAVEAATMPRNSCWLKADKVRLAERRGKKIATVAVARKILTLVFYGLRDGQIRCLEPVAEAA